MTLERHMFPEERIPINRPARHASVGQTYSTWGRKVMFSWLKTPKSEPLDDHRLRNASVEIALPAQHDLWWASRDDFGGELPLGPMMIEQEMVVQPLQSRKLYVAVRLIDFWTALFWVRALPRHAPSVPKTFGGPRADFRDSPPRH